MEKTIKLTCENCSKHFDRSLYEAKRREKDGRRIFCCHKCSSEFKTKVSSVDINCKECGKDFKRRKCEVVENNFCSRSCSNTHSNKKNVGEFARNFKHGNSIYRGTALKEYPNVCMICGFNKEYAIEIHHIDKNRSNNDIKNLAVLCSNCHSGVHKGMVKF